MERRELLKLAERVLRLPTAPYHEQRVKAFVMEFCRELPGVRVEQDRVGNVIIKYHRPQARKAAPLVFVAHMDHPGFEVLGGNRAEFLGGVPKEMFAKGVRLRFCTGLECSDLSELSSVGKRQSADESAHSITKARIASFDSSAWPKRKLVELQTESALRKGDFGMWDVPAFRVMGDQLHAAAIDDVLGTVVMLATLAEISRRKLRAHLWCAFTRAEEVGFAGTVALIREKRIPKAALVVSIEMSKERPWARMGHGPIVRVGDRSTIFDPTATAFLWQVAGKCRERQSAFRAQRCLMDGGSCEATAFVGFGYRAGGLCLPLGNYHNIGKDLRPRAEYVSVNDLAQLVKLTVAAAAEWSSAGATNALLRRRVLSMARTAPRKLKKI
jgi:putative aminopeptidase FrvX